MNGTAQRALRRLTQMTRPLAMRSAGKAGSKNAVVRHTGRRTGQTYQTPVTAAHRDGCFVIALPYGDRTDWMKNVVHAGHATIVDDGKVFEVDRPEVIPMTQATAYFGPHEQRMHRQFHVDTALRVHERAT